MNGPLGETAGKNGRPELPVVTSPTLADVQAELMELVQDGDYTLHMGRVKGLNWARLECAGKQAASTGPDIETAIRRAIMRMGMAL